MAKLRGSLSGRSNKPPLLSGIGKGSSSGQSKSPLPRDLSSHILGGTSTGLHQKALNFGLLHTKVASSASQSGSQWTGLLSSATGGASGLLGGGLLSPSGISLIGKLLNLFGGGKSVPAAPTPFQSPVQRQTSIDIGNSSSSGAISLSAHPVSLQGQGSGIYQQTGSISQSQHHQSSSVIQIVKQALLTSSSLNDVISEI